MVQRDDWARDSFWRELPNAILEQDTRLQKADEWATQARAQVADDFANDWHRQIAQEHPEYLSMLQATRHPVATTPPPPPPSQQPPRTFTPGPTDLESPTPYSAPLPRPIGREPISTVALSGGRTDPGISTDARATLDMLANWAKWAGLGEVGAQVAQAIGVTEGALTRRPDRKDIGDHGRSFGPFQFYKGGGQLANFAADLGMSEAEAGEYARENPSVAAAWALNPRGFNGWQRNGYLYNAVQRGQELGMTGPQLAEYVQRTGQVSIKPERAAENFERLFGTGATGAEGGPALVPQAGRPNTPIRDISQFGDPELSPAEAAAACGPAAAVRFAQRYGRQPTLREALDLAKTVGWTAQQGMAGIASQQRLLEKMGIPTKLVQGPRWTDFAAEVQTGNPVILSTAGHYFTLSAYDPERKSFYVGQSGRDLRGGAEWMTPDEMTRRMGTVQGALFADNPTVPEASTAPEPSSPLDWLGQQKDRAVSTIDNAVQQVGQAFEGANTTIRSAIGDEGGPFSDYGPLGPSTAPGADSPFRPGLDWVAGTSERFPGGAPVAGPLIGGERGRAGFDQLYAEDPQYRALVDEMATLEAQPSPATAAALSSEDRTRVDRIRELRRQIGSYTRDRGIDIFETAQRNPALPARELAAGIQQGVISAAVAPSAASGLARNAAAIAVDPVSAPFIGTQAALGGAARVGRAPSTAAAALEQPADRLTKVGGEVVPIRQAPELTGTDLLAAMAAELRRRGVDAAKVAELERQITAMDPSAAQRRAWTPDTLSRLVDGLAPADASLARTALRGAIQGGIAGAAAEGMQEGEITPAGVLGGAAGGVLRAGAAGQIPALSRVGARTARILADEPTRGARPLPPEEMEPLYVQLGRQHDEVSERIAQVEQQLTDLEEAGEAVVVRPPWGAGLSSAELHEIARQHGTSAARDNWWSEFIDDATEIRRARERLAHFSDRGMATQANLERELASLRAAQDGILRDVEMIEQAAETGRTLYRTDVADVGAQAAEDFGRRLSPEAVGGGNVRASVEEAMLPNKALGGQINMPTTRGAFRPEELTRGAPMPESDALRAARGELTPGAGRGPLRSSAEEQAAFRAAGERLEIARQQRAIREAPAPIPNPRKAAQQVVQQARQGSTRIDYNTLRQLRDSGIEVPLEGTTKAKANAVDHLQAMFANNMISATTSLLMNAGSGTAEMLSRAPRLLVAGYPREAYDTLVYAGAAIGDALRDGGRALWTGARPSAERLGAIARYETQAGAFEGPIGLAATPALRANVATDEVVRTLAAAGAQGAEVNRLARQYKITAEEALERFRPQILKIGREAAEQATFSRGGSGLGNCVADLRAQLSHSPSLKGRLGSLALSLLVPFSRVPDVLLIGGLRRTLGVNEAIGAARIVYNLSPQLQEANRAFLRRLGRPVQDLPPVSVNAREIRLTFADTLMMSAINAGIYSQVLQGNITGAGPENFEKRQALERLRDENGNPVWQRHSIRMGDRWFDYSSLGLLSLPMAILATGHERVTMEGKKPEPEMIPTIIDGTAEVVGNAWYIRSVGDLLGAIGEGELSSKGGRFLTTLGDRVVWQSAMLNQLRGIEDPTVREPRNIGERELNRLPFGASQSVPARIDPTTGEPERVQRDAVSMLLRSVAPRAPEPNDAVRRELQAHEVTVSGDPPESLAVPRFEGVRVALTDDEKREYAVRAGNKIAEYVGKELAQPVYQRAKADDKKERLRRLVNQAREDARADVLRQIGNTEINRRVREQQARLAS